MSSNVKVAVAQINCSDGDFEGNGRKIVEAAARAAAEGADLLVTPELSLTGYPPEDLLLRRAFYAACDASLLRLAGQLLQFPELAVVVGHPLAREGQRFNATSVLKGGMVIGIGAPVLIYVGDDGPMDAMKKKALVSGQTQQDRLQQAPQ